VLLFVGLGNPGPKYALNRHNIGFMAVDRIAERWRFAAWRSRFQGEVAEGEVGGVRVLALKPKTYMNESGRAVAEAARFYKLDLGDLAVFHDELDLAQGRMRVKTGGGNAGHNGLRSISAHLGNDYKRVRLGIGHPGHKDLVLAHVLNDFAKADRDWLGTLVDAVADNADRLAAGDDAGFQNRVHLAMDAAGFSEPKRPGARPTE
jgi:PTH1 family peptidyl-tRNA hydrolase